MIFGLSVLAQLGLDRKKLENWSIWIAIDVISIYVYYNAGLYVTTALYGAFLILAMMGLVTWTKAFNKQGWREVRQPLLAMHGIDLEEELMKNLSDDLIKRSSL